MHIYAYNMAASCPQRRAAAPAALLITLHSVWLQTLPSLSSAVAAAEPETVCPHGHQLLSTLRIAAPADGEDVWGAFSVRACAHACTHVTLRGSLQTCMRASRAACPHMYTWPVGQVRVEFAHRVSHLDPPETLPWAFDVLLDGEHALQVVLKNNSKSRNARSFYLVHIPALDGGPHLVQVALRYPADEDQGSPAWVAPESDRARYIVRGGSRQIPPPAPVSTAGSAGLYAVTLRRRRTSSLPPPVSSTDSDAARSDAVAPHAMRPNYTRKYVPPSGSLGFEEETVRWAPEETAILVVDMWKYHACHPAMQRAHELAARINRVISAARQRGAFIIHVPSSGVEEMAPEYPVQRARMIAAAAACPAETQGTGVPACPAATKTHAGDAVRRLVQSTDARRPEPEVPFAGGGCDDDGITPPPPWDDDTHAQHEGIGIFPRDGLSDNAREIAGALLGGGFRQVVVTGVHANECLLTRPFGLRLLQSLTLRGGMGGGLALGLAHDDQHSGGGGWGETVQVVLARDLTDVLYDPRDSPHCTHREALALVVQHIERYVCPTVLSSQLLELEGEA